ncbi:DUF4936 domain-containing protein [Chromobacterium phragmitis]|uniref:DUF4936 domain-containing protein n=1 Tax=Chromobacterium phragmitis TaxID=2202141 RepID=A0A344UFV6_9NEIS|nr:DUF4936 family protein [Chromobacterium phragmitis]AXE28794.1 DUF4936 domain-containing protein [Chromobacterium phragmitis]AXE34154.1 DUF4936 domain-containing protein [Chromobacterium phragmitis]
MTATLYCYFKAPPERDATLARLRALQGELAAAGWTGELLRRCDDADTWMEVYPGIADRDAFRAAWQAARLRHGLALPASEEWFQSL